MRTAQTFTLDLLLATALVLVVGTIILLYGLSAPKEPRAKADAEALAGAVFAPFPEDWNASTVIIPGFVVRQRLNTTQLGAFAALPTEDVRALTGIASSYFINVSDRFNATVGQAGTPPPADAEAIYVLRRYAAHDAGIVQVEVLAWGD